MLFWIHLFVCVIIITIPLIFKEGHSREVYNVTFHIDGSLVGSCGMDSSARIWDLRSGKCLMVLQGHLKNILAIDFSPNG